MNRLEVRQGAGDLDRGPTDFLISTMFRFVLSFSAAIDKWKTIENSMVYPHHYMVLKFIAVLLGEGVETMNSLKKIAEFMKLMLNETYSQFLTLSLPTKIVTFNTES